MLTHIHSIFCVPYQRANKAHYIEAYTKYIWGLKTTSTLLAAFARYFKIKYASNGNWGRQGKQSAVWFQKLCFSKANKSKIFAHLDQGCSWAGREQWRESIWRRSYFNVSTARSLDTAHITSKDLNNDFCCLLYQSWWIMYAILAVYFSLNVVVGWRKSWNLAKLHHLYWQMFLGSKKFYSPFRYFYLTYIQKYAS